MKPVGWKSEQARRINSYTREVEGNYDEDD
jgi:hypothetical protein